MMTEVELAAVLNHQPEMAEPDVLDNFAPRAAAYARGMPWTDADSALVWASPTARRMFVAERRKVLAALDELWAAAANDRYFVRRAADSDEDTLELGESGVTIRAARASVSGDWLISITLSPDALALLPPGTRVVLTDSAGLQWLAGVPDRDGGIDAYWEHADSPIERLRAHSISIRFA